MTKSVLFIWNEFLLSSDNDEIRRIIKNVLSHIKLSCELSFEEYSQSEDSIFISFVNFPDDSSKFIEIYSEKDETSVLWTSEFNEIQLLLRPTYQNVVSTIYKVFSNHILHEIHLIYIGITINESSNYWTFPDGIFSVSSMENVLENIRQTIPEKMSKNIHIHLNEKSKCWTEFSSKNHQNKDFNFSINFQFTDHEKITLGKADVNFMSIIEDLIVSSMNQNYLPSPPETPSVGCNVISNNPNQINLLVSKQLMGISSLLSVGGFNLVIDCPDFASPLCYNYFKNLPKIDTFLLTSWNFKNTFGFFNMLQFNLMPSIGYFLLPQANQKPYTKSEESQNNLFSVDMRNIINEIMIHVKKSDSSLSQPLADVKKSYKLFYKLGAGTLQMFCIFPPTKDLYKPLKSFYDTWDNNKDTLLFEKLLCDSSLASLLIWSSDDKQKPLRILISSCCHELTLIKSLANFSKTDSLLNGFNEIRSPDNKDNKSFRNENFAKSKAIELEKSTQMKRLTQSPQKSLTRMTSEIQKSTKRTTMPPRSRTVERTKPEFVFQKSSIKGKPKKTGLEEINKLKSIKVNKEVPPSFENVKVTECKSKEISSDNITNEDTLTNIGSMEILGGVEEFTYVSDLEVINNKTEATEETPLVFGAVDIQKNVDLENEPENDEMNAEPDEKVKNEFIKESVENIGNCEAMNEVITASDKKDIEAINLVKDNIELPANLEFKDSIDNNIQEIKNVDEIINEKVYDSEINKDMIEVDDTKENKIEETTNGSSSKMSPDVEQFEVLDYSEELIPETEIENEEITQLTSKSDDENMINSENIKRISDEDAENDQLVEEIEISHESEEFEVIDKFDEATREKDNLTNEATNFNEVSTELVGNDFEVSSTKENNSFETAKTPTLDKENDKIISSFIESEIIEKVSQSWAIIDEPSTISTIETDFSHQEIPDLDRQTKDKLESPNANEKEKESNIEESLIFEQTKTEISVDDLNNETEMEKETNENHSTIEKNEISIENVVKSDQEDVNEELIEKLDSDILLSTKDFIDNEEIVENKSKPEDLSPNREIEIKTENIQSLKEIDTHLKDIGENRPVESTDNETEEDFHYTEIASKTNEEDKVIIKQTELDNDDKKSQDSDTFIKSDEQIEDNIPIDPKIKRDIAGSILTHDVDPEYEFNAIDNSNITEGKEEYESSIESNSKNNQVSENSTEAIEENNKNKVIKESNIEKHEISENELEMTNDKKSIDNSNERSALCFIELEENRNNSEKVDETSAEVTEDNLSHLSKYNLKEDLYSKEEISISIKSVAEDPEQKKLINPEQFKKDHIEVDPNELMQDNKDYVSNETEIENSNSNSKDDSNISSSDNEEKIIMQLEKTEREHVQDDSNEYENENQGLEKEIIINNTYEEIPKSTEEKDIQGDSISTDEVSGGKVTEVRLLQDMGIESINNSSYEVQKIDEEHMSIDTVDTRNFDNLKISDLDQDINLSDDKLESTLDLKDSIVKDAESEKEFNENRQDQNDFLDNIDTDEKTIENVSESHEADNEVSTSEVAIDNERLDAELTISVKENIEIDTNGAKMNIKTEEETQIQIPSDTSNEGDKSILATLDDIEKDDVETKENMQVESELYSSKPLMEMDNNETLDSDKTTIANIIESESTINTEVTTADDSKCIESPEIIKENIEIFDEESLRQENIETKANENKISHEKEDNKTAIRSDSETEGDNSILANLIDTDKDDVETVKNKQDDAEVFSDKLSTEMENNTIQDTKFEEKDITKEEGSFIKIKDCKIELFDETLECGIMTDSPSKECLEDTNRDEDTINSEAECDIKLSSNSIVIEEVISAINEKDFLHMDSLPDLKDQKGELHEIVLNDFEVIVDETLENTDSRTHEETVNDDVICEDENKNEKDQINIDSDQQENQDVSTDHVTLTNNERLSVKANNDNNVIEEIVNELVIELDESCVEDEFNENKMSNELEKENKNNNEMTDENCDKKYQQTISDNELVENNSVELEENKTCVEKEIKQEDKFGDEINRDFGSKVDNEKNEENLSNKNENLVLEEPNIECTDTSLKENEMLQSEEKVINIQTEETEITAKYLETEKPLPNIEDESVRVMSVEENYQNLNSKVKDEEIFEIRAEHIITESKDIVHELSDETDIIEDLKEREQIEHQIETTEDNESDLKGSVVVENSDKAMEMNEHYIDHEKELDKTNDVNETVIENLDAKVDLNKSTDEDDNDAPVGAFGNRIHVEIIEMLNEIEKNQENNESCSEKDTISTETQNPIFEIPLGVTVKTDEETDNNKVDESLHVEEKVENKNGMQTPNNEITNCEDKDNGNSQENRNHCPDSIVEEVDKSLIIIENNPNVDEENLEFKLIKGDVTDIDQVEFITESKIESIDTNMLNEAQEKRLDEVNDSKNVDQKDGQNIENNESEKNEKENIEFCDDNLKRKYEDDDNDKDNIEVNEDFILEEIQNVDQDIIGEINQESYELETKTNDNIMTTDQRENAGKDEPKNEREISSQINRKKDQNNAEYESKITTDEAINEDSDQVPDKTKEIEEIESAKENINEKIIDTIKQECENTLNELPDDKVMKSDTEYDPNTVEDLKDDELIRNTIQISDENDSIEKMTVENKESIPETSTEMDNFDLGLEKLESKNLSVKDSDKNLDCEQKINEDIQIKETIEKKELDEDLVITQEDSEENKESLKDLNLDEGESLFSVDIKSNENEYALTEECASINVVNPEFERSSGDEINKNIVDENNLTLEKEHQEKNEPKTVENNNIVDHAVTSVKEETSNCEATEDEEENNDVEIINDDTQGTLLVSEEENEFSQKNIAFSKVIMEKELIEDESPDLNETTVNTIKDKNNLNDLKSKPTKQQDRSTLKTLYEQDIETQVSDINALKSDNASFSRESDVENKTHTEIENNTEIKTKDREMEEILIVTLKTKDENENLRDNIKSVELEENREIVLDETSNILERDNNDIVDCTCVKECINKENTNKTNIDLINIKNSESNEDLKMKQENLQINVDEPIENTRENESNQDLSDEKSQENESSEKSPESENTKYLEKIKTESKADLLGEKDDTSEDKNDNTKNEQCPPLDFVREYEKENFRTEKNEHLNIEKYDKELDKGSDIIKELEGDQLIEHENTNEIKLSLESKTDDNFEVDEIKKDDPEIMSKQRLIDNENDLCQVTNEIENTNSNLEILEIPKVENVDVEIDENKTLVQEQNIEECESQNKINVEKNECSDELHPGEHPKEITKDPSKENDEDKDKIVDMSDSENNIPVIPEKDDKLADYSSKTQIINSEEIYKHLGEQLNLKEGTKVDQIDPSNATNESESNKEVNEDKIEFESQIEKPTDVDLVFDQNDDKKNLKIDNQNAQISDQPIEISNNNIKVDAKMTEKTKEEIASDEDWIKVEEESEDNKNSNKNVQWSEPLGLPMPVMPDTPSRKPIGKSSDGPSTRPNSNFNTKSKETQESTQGYYLDIAYVPVNIAGNIDSSRVSERFFTKVRANCYILPGLEHDVKIFNNIIIGKSKWNNKDKQTKTHIIVMNNTSELKIWLLENSTKLSELNIHFDITTERENGLTNVCKHIYSLK